MRRKLTCLAATFCLLGALRLGFSQTTAPVLPETQDPVEICFVLDTTGSMSGLIDGAKRKIWLIANDIVAANPKRPLKMGLVAYRDKGDTYITQTVDLTSDLDELYQKLMAFKADGGGDTPESVNQALRDSVEKIHWSDTKGATKLIFLVGDSPPHMDYQDDLKYPQLCETAVKHNLVINTVLCGNNQETLGIWKEIAQKSEGSFLAIPQDGNMAVINTPMDDKLAKLNSELGKTVVAYGSATAQAAVSGKLSVSSSMIGEANAERAKLNNKDGGRAIQGSGDLVFDSTKDQKLLEQLPADKLPPELQKMTAEERKAFVEKQGNKRAELNQQIAKLVVEREKFIAEEAKKQPNAKGDSFDQKVTEIIREQMTRNPANPATTSTAPAPK